MKYSELEDPTLVLEKLMANSGRDGAGQTAYKYFTHKYFRPIPNETSEPIKRMQMLIPGRFYTYKYDPLYKDKLDFYDTRPVMLCIKTYIHPNTGNNLQLGLNMNFIPREIRVFVMSGIWRTFKPYIKKDLAGRPRNDGGVVMRQKLLFTENFDVYELLNYILETIGKTHWKFGIRQYIFDRITNPKLIDYPDWGYIPMLDSKELIGISEREMLKLYWKTKHKIGRKH